MSVVCCRVSEDKIEIASDSITIRGYTQSKGFNVRLAKLAKVNGLIVGGVGMAQENALFQIFCETRKPKDATCESIVIFLSEFSDWKYKKVDKFGIENNFNIILIYHSLLLSLL